MQRKGHILDFMIMIHDQEFVQKVNNFRFKHTLYSLSILSYHILKQKILKNKHKSTANNKIISRVHLQ